MLFARTIDGAERDASYPNFIVPSYVGHDYLTVSAITMNTIDVVLSSAAVPFTLMASARNVTATGSRDNTGALLPYIHLEHEWTLTYNDDSPIDWYTEDELINSRGYTANPYAGHKAPEFAVPIRKPGTYKLTLTSRAPGISNSTTATITATWDTAIAHRWYDESAGNDANDGFDPWGFATSTASYTESTGVLSQTNAFASYDHAAATTGNPTDWYNMIYLVSADSGALGSWHRIASKTDNSNIVLEDKIGSNQTNVVSSDGAKATWVGEDKGAAYNGGGAAPAAELDVFVHLRGNNGASSYTLTESMCFATGETDNNYTVRWGGYDTNADGVDVIATQTMFDVRSGDVIDMGLGVGANMARFSSSHNLDITTTGLIDGCNGMGGNLNDGSNADPVYYFQDRVNITEGSGGINCNNGLEFYFSRWKGSIDNRIARSYDSGTATAGSSGLVLEDTSKSWTTNEWVGYSVINDTDASITSDAQQITGNTATTLTVAGLSFGTDNDFDSGDSYRIVPGKAHAAFDALLGNTSSRMASVGVFFTTDSERPNHDHYLYPTSDHGNIYLGYNLFGGNTASDLIPSGPSYAINLDAKPKTSAVPANIAKYFCIAENYCSGGCDWFVDASGGGNDPATYGTLEDIYVSRNAATTRDGFTQFYSGTKGFWGDNVYFSNDAGSSLFFIPGTNGTDPLPDRSDIDYVLARNKSYGEKTDFFNYAQTTTGPKLEVVDNIAYSFGDTDCTIVSANWEHWSVSGHFIDNQFYDNGDDLDGDIYSNPGSGRTDLATFNAAGFNSGNTEGDPGWTDPANGDFT